VGLREYQTVAAREVSQKGGGARRGSENEREIRLAVEALWPSREPIRRRAQIPSERKRRLRTDLAVPHPPGQKEDHDDADDDESEPDHFRVRLRADS